MLIKAAKNGTFVARSQTKNMFLMSKGSLEMSDTYDSDYEEKKIDFSL